MTKVMREVVVTVIGFTFMAVVVVPWMMSRINDVTQRSFDRMKDEQLATQERIKADQEKARLERQQTIVMRDAELARLRQQIDEQKAAEQRRLDAEQAKEAAWRTWYKRPSSCRQGGDAVTCGNDYIVKRREFNRLYEKGLVK